METSEAGARGVLSLGEIEKTVVSARTRGRGGRRASAGGAFGRDAPSSGHIMRRHLAVRAEAPWKWSRGPRLAAQSR